MKDISVLRTVRYTNDNVKGIQPGFSAPYFAVSGKNSLVHRVIKIMLTPLGSNLYYPDLGTSINALTRASTANAKEKDIRVALGQVIDQTTAQIKNEQSNYPTLSLNELLDKIDIIDILFNEDTNSWKFKLAIYNQNNQLSVLEI